VTHLLAFLAGAIAALLLERWRAWERGVDLDPVDARYWHLQPDPPDPHAVELMGRATARGGIGGVG
jgi:hypothetical protein